MLRHIRIALLVAFAALTYAVPTWAQTFPALSGRVVDQAGILSRATRTELTGRLAALEAQNTDQLVVATVSSLEGFSIEDYANRLFRHWQLGQKDKNNGVLLLVAPNERKVRIEVGYGLEGTLTDAVSKLIISESIIPHFAAKDMPAGVVQGVDDLVSVLGGDTAVWQRRAAASTSPASSNVHVVNLPPAIGYVLLIVIYGVGALMFGFMAYAIGFGIFRAVISFLVLIHVLPDRKHRRGSYKWVTAVESVGSGSSGSGSSSSSDSFSGGGGSSGGGGASGSW
jgi:uncharacterized protein